MLSRSIAIQNRHPRLAVPAAAVRRAIARLDADFRIVAADLPTFAPARRAALRPTLAPVAATRPRVKSAPHSSAIPSACPPGELSLVFLTDEALAGLHAQFMDDPTTTDVITFEGDTTAGLAGEICVSADTAFDYAHAHGRDFATELTLYLVHGWLHLAGYDDLRPAKKRRMRAAETRAMRLLTTANALPAFRRR